MRKILIYLESRASYSYALPLINILKKKKKNFLFKTLITGMHLEKEFGHTFKEVKKDRVKIDYKIKFPNKKNWPFSIGKILIECSKILKNFNPDLVVIFGDRVELVPISIASSYNGTAIAHVQAGDKSGHIDDMTRMMLSKIVHIHLPSTEISAKRLLKLGEQNFRVFNVGAPQLDDIKYDRIIKNRYVNLNNKLFNLKKEKFIILIQHPVFADRKNYKNIFFKTLKACLSLNFKTILIYPNYDPGYKDVIKLIKNQDINKKKLIVLKNLERKTFLNLLANAKCLVGNSSCGILEAPSLKVGVINIGDRQDGREKNKNIIDCGYSTKEIIKKINYVTSNRKFQKNLKKIKNFYGEGKSGQKIFNIISRIKLDKNLLYKKTTY